MKKSMKSTAAILAGSLMLTPIIGTINNNIAKAENKNITINNNQLKTNIEKHIKKIDKEINLINNKLIINKENVIKYIEKNWNELKKSSNYNTQTEYYNNIELLVNNINKKVNSGLYEFNNDKSITSKYQTRDRGGYESYYQWWGAQYYAHTSYGAENLARDCEDVANVGAAASIVLGACTLAIPAAYEGVISINFSRMASKVRYCFNDYGSVKLSVYAAGLYFETEPIQ